MPRKPNPTKRHNSPTSACKVVSAWEYFPKGLVNSQIGIIRTFYPRGKINKTPITKMTDRQVFKFSENLYKQANELWDSLTPTEKNIAKLLAGEKTEDLAERVAVILEGDTVPDNSPIYADTNRILGFDLEEDSSFDYELKPTQLKLFDDIPDHCRC
jgi:hypothetical protein